jgi:hypothetical protein
MAIEETWDDTFETLPTDIEKFKLGPDKIRDIKKATRSRMQIDHEFATADSGTDTGYHKRVTFKKVSGGPSEAASGYVECAYDSDDNLIKYFPEGGAEEVLVEKDETQTLTNKTLTSPTINTPNVNEAAALTATSTDINKTASVSGALVGTTDSQTLSSKTLTSPIINTPDINGGTVDTTIIGGAGRAAGSFTTLYSTFGLETDTGSVYSQEIRWSWKTVTGQSAAVGAYVSVSWSINTGKEIFGVTGYIQQPGNSFRYQGIVKWDGSYIYMQNNSPFTTNLTMSLLIFHNQ